MKFNHVAYLLLSSILLSSCGSVQFSKADSSSSMRAIASAFSEDSYNQNNEYENSFLNLDAYDLTPPEMTKEGQAVNKCRHVAGLSGASLVKGKVALTFDDGPSYVNTPIVLSILRKYNIKATFFMTGEHINKYPQIVDAVQAEGHLVGNHTYSHQTIPLLTFENQKKEIDLADKPLKKYFAKQKMSLFRFPFGSSSCEAISYIGKELKYTGMIGWHVDTCDWAYEKTGTVTSKIALRDCGINPKNLSNYQGHVMEQLNRKGGGIILMHETNNNTVRNLEEIIIKILKLNYKFTNLNDPDMRQFFKTGI